MRRSFRSNQKLPEPLENAAARYAVNSVPWMTGGGGIGGFVSLAVPAGFTIMAIFVALNLFTENVIPFWLSLGWGGIIISAIISVLNPLVAVFNKWVYGVSVGRMYDWWLLLPLGAVLVSAVAMGWLPPAVALAMLGLGLGAAVLFAQIFALREVRRLLNNPTRGDMEILLLSEELPRNLPDPMVDILIDVTELEVWYEQLAEARAMGSVPRGGG